jgi:hypothetical protein
VDQLNRYSSELETAGADRASLAKNINELDAELKKGSPDRSLIRTLLTDVEPARSSHIERRSRPAASALPSTSSRNTGRIFSAASSLRPDAEPPYQRALAIRETPKIEVRPSMIAQVAAGQ